MSFGESVVLSPIPAMKEEDTQKYQVEPSAFQNFQEHNIDLRDQRH